MWWLDDGVGRPRHSTGSSANPCLQHDLPSPQASGQMPPFLPHAYQQSMPDSRRAGLLVTPSAPLLPLAAAAAAPPAMPPAAAAAPPAMPLAATVVVEVAGVTHSWCLLKRELITAPAHTGGSEGKPVLQQAFPTPQASGQLPPFSPQRYQQSSPVPRSGALVVSVSSCSDTNTVAAAVPAAAAPTVPAAASPAPAGSSRSDVAITDVASTH
mmetsp:Transcript_9687/g.18623  ORF Transcript_9687/g.18623 Transcript_9687/m.18623 type:complete len:212 (-) Transcript_9687:622-1257(-)